MPSYLVSAGFLNSIFLFLTCTAGLSAKFRLAFAAAQLPRRRSRREVRAGRGLAAPGHPGFVQR